MSNVLSAPLPESSPVVQIEQLVSKLEADLPSIDLETPTGVWPTSEQFDSLTASW